MSDGWQVPRSRQEAAEADRADALAGFRAGFVLEPGGPVYLDGNSLGRQPIATAGAVSDLLSEWGRDLVAGWERWAELPERVGDRIGQLLGAAPGQVVVGDSTTVNLYKLAVAAADARPGRPTIVGDANDFPTLRYVLESVAGREGRRLLLVDSDPAEAATGAELSGVMGDDVAFVCMSAVNYRSGAVADVGAVCQAAHEAGALTVWDLSHAAGVVPLQLDADGADFAAGCGYKYLNGGPGAPAWLYVRSDLQGLRQPIWGWWGQRDRFAMGPSYDPVQGTARFLAGTPAVLGLVALGCGIGPVLAAGVPAIWAKTSRLVALLTDRAMELLAPLGVRFSSPAGPEHRGGHLALAHAGARTVTGLLAEKRLVVADFRYPDVMRLAPVAMYTRFVDV
ncbi:MAG: kynureninase, partial [Acidimicrobiales bacterium]